ncbi:MAG TPA: hypothetical protein VFH78_04400 [Candidatus Thermoplasmatota archaeon]|nr:hypothetical protein [Candidatus Thermoplasmatota archaeon]
MAALVYLARPRRPQNRRLALMCALFGSGVGLLAGLRPLADDLPTAYALYVTYLPAFYGAVPVYVLFLATLDSPLTRPLRHPLLQGGVILYFGAMCVLTVVRPDLFIDGYARNAAFGHWSMHETPLYRWGLQGASALVMLYGAVVAVDYWRRAATPLTRRQAGVYAVAFVARDALVFGVGIAGALGLDFSTTAGGIAALVVLPLAEILLALLLAYGILSTQLFEIDLKLKWTIRRGSVAATFVGVFFIVSEGAQQVFSARWGPAFGLIAASGLVFAIAPLQRVADRLADAAMPGVKDTPEYRESRRRAIYKNAVASALQDGIVTETERDVLATLASDLGLTPRDTLELEREAMRERAA